jgi:hypothetical protein
MFNQRCAVKVLQVNKKMLYKYFLDFVSLLSEYRSYYAAVSCISEAQSVARVSCAFKSQGMYYSRVSSTCMSQGICYAIGSRASVSRTFLRHR